MDNTQPQPDQQESGPEFLILASLSDGPRDVYAMVEEIDRLAGVRLGPDVLCCALARLARRGLVEPLVTGDLHQPYWLTDAGAKIAHARFMRLASQANARWFSTWKTRVKTRLQPGEVLQDPVRGSYEGSPIYRPAATGKD
jgi:DNA-binding PadR family transcriptional regulator